MMRRCPDLSAYLDGELNARARARVEAHLAECPACREELAALQRVHAHLLAWSAPNAPARTAARLAEALEQQAPRRAPVYARLAWGTALAAVLAGAYLAYPRHVAPPQQYALRPTPVSVKTKGTAARAMDATSAKPVANYARVGAKYDAVGNGMDRFVLNAYYTPPEEMTTIALQETGSYSPTPCSSPQDEEERLRAAWAEMR